jgi:putative ABC transport system ATP-binding protein
MKPAATPTVVPDLEKPSSSKWLIETRQLTKSYRMGTTDLYALREVDLRLAPGDFVALMGPSGSGKSTLLQLLGCLDTPSSGSYLLEGRDVSTLSSKERSRLRNQKIGFIFQTFNLLPRLNALENVTLPLLYRKKSGDANKLAQRALARVGLTARLGHLPNEMSGGERQRVAIARALVSDPALLLADEPTGNLDSHTGMEVMQLLVSLWRDGRTILLVTHDPNVAAYAQRTLNMQDGRILSEEVHDVSG